MSEHRYSVKEIFRTIQGEGSRAGMSCVFVRFAGCNMWSGLPDKRASARGACGLWCDTDFTLQSARKLTADEIVRECADTRWVVLTGGEPFLQIDIELMMAMAGAGINVSVETNGTILPRPEVLGLIDHLCVSPKLPMIGSPQLDWLEIWKATELKIVLGANDRWTEALLLMLENDGEWKHRFVQPLDPIDPNTVEVSVLRGGVSDTERLRDATDRCIEWVHNHPTWRLGVQLHKILGMP